MYSLIRPNEQLLHQVYMKDFNWKFDYLSHNLNLFSLGPSLSLVCDIPPSIACNIRAFKGSALPIQLDQSSLRGKLNISDRCINGVHMADSEERSLLEIQYIYHLCPFNAKMKAQTYEDVKANLLDHQFEEYSSVETDISLKTVLRHMLIRINQFIIFYDLVNGEYEDKAANHPVSLLKNNICRIPEESFPRDVLPLNRFWDYFFAVLNMNMIYYHPFEKYIIQSENLYSEIDCNPIPKM